MKTLREIIYFLQYVAANQETLKIRSMEMVVIVMLMSFKSNDYKRILGRFLVGSVTKKTTLYTIVLNALKRDIERPYEEYYVIGRWGKNGDGKEELERVRRMIYRYGKFESILKERGEDLWL